MNEFTLTVETPPAVEIDVSSTSVELSVAPTSVDLEVAPPSVIELAISPPPVVELSADRASTITLNIDPPPIIEFNVGGIGGTGGPVVEEVQISELVPTDPAVELWLNLLEDPPGGGGGGGTGDVTYTHHQSVLASVWTVVHNLSKRPSVSAQDAVGNVIYGTVTYIDNNTLTITFKNAITGRADCN